ncbi:MAG: alpha/beta fold hydrolase, partial [Actinobacteria bacterium]|nr:alpha/beta fold hydrolase [Actinomycetota bacterium]
VVPPAPTDDVVALPDGRPRLAVRTLPGERRPFLLVHGLSSNARLWDGVARHLAAAGPRVVAVGQRGPGRSQAPDDGYDTDTCADDLAALVDVLGLTGEAAPVVVGQSWGGNVVLSLAARHPGSAAAVACVDGGWIRLRDRFASFEECWAALAPPQFEGMRYDDLAARIRSMRPDWPAEGLEGTLANLERLPDGGVRPWLSREHHREIVRSLFEGDPGAWYPRVGVPVLLVPATGGEPADGDDERTAGARAAVLDALAHLPDGAVRWYPGADHDIHAEQPESLAADLLTLAGRVPEATHPAATDPAAPTTAQEARS